MSLAAAVNFIPVYVLVLFRIAGMMAMAPLLGSTRIPRRVKVLMACLIAFSMAAGVKPPEHMPATYWELAVGLGGEIVFGVAMGMILTFVFVAAQWAGEMIGQQMGLNLGESFDPSFGGQGSVVGDFFFMLMLVVFLAVDGHRAMLEGVRASFDALPLLSVGMDRPLFDLLVGLFEASAVLAFRLAAPVLVTMLILDLAMGFIGKTIPQLNLMSAGTSLRGVVAMLVLILGIGLTSEVLRDAAIDSMRAVCLQWSSPR